MNILVATVLVLILSGCGGGTAKQHARYDAYLSLMNGLSVEQLMNSWGQPDDTTQFRNGNKALIYIEQWEMPVSEYNLFTGQNETVRKAFRCTTSFEIGPDDLVRAYDFEGNGCGSTRLRTLEQ